MASTIPVSEARAALPEMLDRVAGGEEITITRHGVAIAVLVRPDVLRIRRGEAAMSAAEELRQRMKAAARARRAPAVTVMRKRAEALLREVRASRARG
jgi:antitoxin (DNA-binding transcriptional repressor) of toxin-antitoxin stability system